MLKFVGRFGVMQRAAVARWADTARTSTLQREKRLRDEGLLEVRKPWFSSEPVLLATKTGLAACGRDDLFPARVSAPTLRHFSIVAHLAAVMERDGAQLLSERELRCHERALGAREFSVRLPGGRHQRPDLILLGERPSPIEVELTAKGRVRLDQIVAAWKAAVLAGRFAAVLYRCSSEALPYVERSSASKPRRRSTSRCCLASAWSPPRI